AVESTMRIGDILAESGRADDATKELKTIIEKYPGTQFEKVASRRIGDILKERGLYNAAVEKYKVAITETQSNFNAETQYLIGECYEESGDAEQAIPEFLKVKYLYPEVKRWSGRAQLRAATLFEGRQRWKDAAKIYEELASGKYEEAKYAKERLDWIKTNVPGNILEVK
ncbi:MAG: tetratricopeptide repeat protein, partial [Candidatus Omnitrophica bacterium]|nr:tetratricopeptide repeat protein [Candidatus Omnitrophota bacterium]